MFAVFKRNFVSYFLNPTGYVFICVFVLLNSVAAFVPDEFVNSNLANLAQLNLWFPLIALVFAPAVAMGVWADEKRLGTDELLTTQPITSRDIVLGKYFACALVYTVSLLFSAVANFAILSFLGSPDKGLFLTTYFGYWLIGLATTSLAMVVSFMTSQLTASYILGALINMPLVALQWSDALPISSRTANALKTFSINAFFEPFGRGIVSLSGILYFVAIPCVAVYVCVVLLNKRNWRASHAWGRAARYAYRTVAWSVLAVSIVGFTRDHDLRADCTEEKLSALSPSTIELIDRDYAEYPIVVEARLSAQVPSEYVQTKINIISILNELKNRSKSEIFLDIQEIAPNTQEAYRLERQYNIRPRKVLFDERGQLREDSIFMSLVFRCGSNAVVIPFLNRGLSVEYELVSSLMRVASPPKKRIGVLETDAGAFGRFDAYGRELQKPWPLIDELRKEYVVEQVDARAPIPRDRYAALIAFQPSALTPPEMINFINAVRVGQPTAIFEDPHPVFLEDFLPGTLEKRRSTPLNPIPPLKGEISMLWAALGMRFDGGIVLWKNYNPYPKLAGLSQEYLFVDSRPIHYAEDARRDEVKDVKSFAAFNSEEPVVASLEHLLFPFVGRVTQSEDSETKFTPLVRVEAGGYSSVSDVQAMGIRTQSRNRAEREAVYTLAARISGAVPEHFRIKDDANVAPEYNVVVVADVDMATPGFFTLREMGTDVRSGVAFDFDNNSFVLNLVDDLASESSLISIRSRRPRHRTLERIEETTRKIRDRAMAAQIAYTREFEEERRKEESALQQTVRDLSERDASKKELSREESLELQAAIIAAQQRLTAKLDEKQRLLNHKIEEEQREVDEFTRQVQGRYKAFAAILPPIPPLIIGFCVFIYRRRRQGAAYGL